MKRNMSDVFEHYCGGRSDADAAPLVSAERIYELTKEKIEKDGMKMEKSVKRKWNVALIAAAVMVLMSATVFAAYHFLSPSDVAKHLGEDKLAAVFAENGTQFQLEPQISGEYSIALLGMTGGKNLDTYTEVDVDKTYIVGAISKADGTALEDYTNFMITPLVEGYEPWQVNIFTLSENGKHAFLQDGVEYFLLECESIDIFADHTVYAAVYEGISPSREIFSFDADGTIGFQPEYTGVKALFELPLDESKADPDAVKAMFGESASDGSGEINVSDEEKTKDDFQITETKNENGETVLLIEDKEK